MSEEMDVLQRIKDLCRERNYSYYELAKRSGIPYSTLNTLLLKGAQPSMPTLKRLCAGLGISLQQFFAGEDEATILTAEQKECLSLFNVLTSEEQALAIAYMKGLAHRL
ncbi:MAG: helix-turn-helix transcriptional regulator [Eubacteriales bacterium]|nr:helix-turn-helix transcriptional regulator [Eubacteriales bacterium]